MRMYVVSTGCTELWIISMKDTRFKEEINITFLIIFQLYPRKKYGGYISHILPNHQPTFHHLSLKRKLFDHRFLLSSAISSSSSRKATVINDTSSSGWCRDRICN
ncbi:hypothetical protein HanPI659440_Chr09g0328041 [Helianthus annuus]|nr:hypothetical protein HanPI659440_Chr09g0328041 [Helianthus annuus]